MINYKWLPYAIIVLAVSGLFVMIAVVVIKPIQDKADVQIMLKEEKVNEALEIADSIKGIIPLKEKEIEKAKTESETKYITLKKAQQSQLSKLLKQNEQESKRIDTLPADVIDSMFTKYIPKDRCNR